MTGCEEILRRLQYAHMGFDAGNHRLRPAQAFEPLFVFVLPQAGKVQLFDHGARRRQLRQFRDGVADACRILL